MLYVEQLSEYAQDSNGNFQQSGDIFNPQIGDSYGGGTIFYIDSTGKHGLICSGVLGSLMWDPTETPTQTFATKTEIGSGLENTDKIIDVHGFGSYAAALCKLYAGGGFNDWYMPSKDELEKIGQAGFLTDDTWSSSEDDSDYWTAWAWIIGFSFMQGNERKMELHVRAIRSF